MDDRHVGAGAIQLQCGIGRRVAAADDDDALAVVRMSLTVVVVDVRQILSRNAQHVRAIVVADRQDDRPAVANAANAALRAGFNGKRSYPTRPTCPTCPTCPLILFPLDRQDLLFECDLQIVGVDDSAVVAKRLSAGRLVVWGHEWQPANLQQFRRREEDHLRRKAIDRIDEHPLLEDLVVEAVTFCGDGGGEARRSRANNEKVANGHVFYCRLLIAVSR